MTVWELVEYQLFWLIDRSGCNFWYDNQILEGCRFNFMTMQSIFIAYFGVRVCGSQGLEICVTDLSTNGLLQFFYPDLWGRMMKTVVDNDQLGRI